MWKRVTDEVKLVIIHERERGECVRKWSEVTHETLRVVKRWY